MQRLLGWLWCYYSYLSQALVFRGTLQQSGPWAYLERFCFNGDYGAHREYQVVYNVSFEERTEIYLLVYLAPSDDISKWIHVYQSGDSCSQLVQTADLQLPLHTLTVPAADTQDHGSRGYRISS